jgi:hypothetical protein
MEEVHAAAQVRPAMPEASAGMLAQEEAGEEHHGDDEDDTGDDADPREHAVEPVGLGAGPRRRIDSRRRSGRMLNSLGHVIDHADAGEV